MLANVACLFPLLFAEVSTVLRPKYQLCMYMSTSDPTFPAVLGDENILHVFMEGKWNLRREGQDFRTCALNHNDQSQLFKIRTDSFKGLEEIDIAPIARMFATLSNRSTVPATVPIQHARLNGSAFFSGEALCQRPSSARVQNRTPLSVQNFKFMKDLGFKKPAFLPDFGLVGGRQASFSR